MESSELMSYALTSFRGKSSQTAGERSKGDPPTHIHSGAVMDGGPAVAFTALPMKETPALR